MKKIILLFVFTTGFAIAQQKNEIPRDTSFNIRSTTISVYKSYPNTKVVVPNLPENVKAEENIIYTSYGDRNLHLDLFMPKKGGSYPGVLLIHGGGWRSGDRSMEVPMAQFIAAHGYVTAVVEYRLSVEALYPAAIHDLKTALRWMRANAVKYNIDTNKIAVYGCSAGGQLAFFMGATNGIKKFEGDGYLNHSSRVQAVITLDGIYDMTRPSESGKDTIPTKPSGGKAWFGGAYKNKPEIWKEASSIFYVDEKMVPSLFVNSSLERYHGGRNEMIEKLKKLNIYYETYTIPNTPHPFWLFHPWFDEASSYIVNFLDKIFKKG